MKTKIILLAVMLICLAMTVLAQNEKQVTKSTGNVQNNRASVEQTLMEIEKATWKNIVDKKFEDFGKLLADDYQSVYAMTRNTKATELAGVTQTTFKAAVVSDLKVQMANAEVGIVTALVKAEITRADGKTAATNFRTTSVYAKREGAWLIVFHTDEPIADTK